ncbi:penicillin-binding transpeptidase domain-containing protein [Virgibacillus saliphilus]|uniref:penicillin-binding transpeptidase domain-containing protein n=1 Tax=Virgibacillus saliphilus TaxID=2831674 RepID=UPI0021039E1A|nr:penicillin-binding transpeptidase domain-containing protein [Virgibacillus sp. NKC19-3]
MKKGIAFIVCIVAVLLTACSSNEPTPNERLASYIEQWKNQEFEEMHEMISSQAAKAYPKEEFVDRYSKIYQDLDISELNVTFEELDEEEVDTAIEQGEATIPFSVEMETIAEPIQFDYEATLIKENKGEEEEENWYVQWDSGFIFPEMKDGGQVSLETETPTRGEILDRNQIPLAMNDIVYEVGIIPEELGENPEQAKESIAESLHMNVEAIDTALNADWVEPTLFVPLKEVPQTDEDVLDELWEIPGAAGREITGRVYPSDEAAGHLIGNIKQVTADDLEEQESGEYDENDMIGARGLELLYEDRLKGKKGIKIVVSNEDDEEDVVLAEQPVEDGENISLTIDVNVQEEIYDAFDGDAGTSAAIDPKSGETLALVSSPSFDPNDLLYDNSQDLWDDLQNDEQSPLTNRFNATYAPGSVIKPITAAIGLESGSLDPNEGIEIDGLTWSNGEGWGDYEVRRVSESDGPVDLNDALVRSDNIYFAMQGIEMGSETLTDGFEQFGFAEEIPYEYPIETSTIATDETIDDEVLLANTSYGQGEIEMSALHLAATYTSLLNEGDMIKPTLLTSEDTEQIWREDLISPEDATLISDALRDVVTDGTAQEAQEADFPISGKTGTAELKLTTDDEEGEINSWFVGYPTEEQDILISMMMEQTQDKESGYTVEVATDILTELE